MKQCAACAAFITGYHEATLCYGCELKLKNSTLYSDPHTSDALVRRLQQREHMTRRLHHDANVDKYMPYQKPVNYKGVCPLCERPIDDHRLTYDPRPDAVAACANGAAPTDNKNWGWM